MGMQYSLRTMLGKMGGEFDNNVPECNCEIFKGVWRVYGDIGQIGANNTFFSLRHWPIVLSPMHLIKEKRWVSVLERRLIIWGHCRIYVNSYYNVKSNKSTRVGFDYSESGTFLEWPKEPIPIGRKRVQFLYGKNTSYEDIRKPSKMYFYYRIAKMTSITPCLAILPHSKE